MRFIFLFFPGLLALKNGVAEKDKSYQIISKYAGYTLLINGLILLALLIISNPHYLIEDELFSFRFSLLYIVAGSVLAIILPIIINYIKNNMSISIKRNRKWRKQ